MIVGIPREIKDGERRVGMTPDGVAALVAHGHTVLVQSAAGVGSAFLDGEYVAAGATIVSSANAAYAADLVVKVKEIQSGEWQQLKPDSTLFCFQQLLTSGEVPQQLLSRRICAIAYETVTDTHGALPLLAPMSRISGELAILIGANLLMTPSGGSGVLLRDAHVVIVGAGNVGVAAARTAAKLGAKVTLLVRNIERTQALASEIGASVVAASVSSVGETSQQADLVIGAVNVPGERTPKLLKREAVQRMRPGSVIIDACIDGGGIAETSRLTSLSDPTYMEAGVIHYCVSNMPASVARSATLALTSATLPYILALADKGVLAALRDDAGLAAGLQMAGGKITHRGIADSLHLDCVPAAALLQSC